MTLDASSSPSGDYLTKGQSTTTMSTGENTTLTDMTDTTTFFSPPLWFQRRSLVLALLREAAAAAAGTSILDAPESNSPSPIRTVLDLGCGEGALLQVLVNEASPYTHILGVDLDGQCCRAAIKASCPTPADHVHLRPLPMRLEVYQGDLSHPDPVIQASQVDAITAIEVIEHLDPPAVAAFAPVTLGIYRPRVMIVTTPNAEFNIHFPTLHYGTAHAVFRHDDHRFEWTRAEFEAWAYQAASTYGYEVAFRGVGMPYRQTPHLPPVGTCTQVAVFTRLTEEEAPSAGILAEAMHALSINPAVSLPSSSFTLCESIQFPCFDQSLTFTPEQVVSELKDHVKYMVGRDFRVIDSSFSSNQYMQSYLRLIRIHSLMYTHDLKDDAIREGAEHPMRLRIQELWSALLSIRQMCKYVGKFVDVLKQFPEEFRLIETRSDGMANGGVDKGMVVELLYPVEAIVHEEEEELDVELENVPSPVSTSREEHVVVDKSDEGGREGERMACHDHGYPVPDVNMDIPAPAETVAYDPDGTGVVETAEDWSGPVMGWGVPSAVPESPVGRWA